MARRRKQPEEHENVDRWMISYADFVTLLFAFFVVMYAISSVNDGKYRVLSDSLVSAFKTSSPLAEPVLKEGVQTSMPLPDATLQLPLPMQSTQSPPVSETLSKMQELAQDKLMQQVANDAAAALEPLVAQGGVNIQRNEFWVEISISSSMLFPSGSAGLQPAVIPALTNLAQVLSKASNPIQVEGFTDNVPISTVAFPSNWELSAARAANVVHLFGQHQVEPERMAAVGFGEYRPIAPNDTPAGREKNRRIAVVVLADRAASHIRGITRVPAQQAPPPAAGM